MTQASATGSALIVQLSSLSDREKINEGANAAIYRLPRTQIRSNPGPLVFKEYFTTKASMPALLRVVQAREAQDQPRRDLIDALAAWPLRVVARPDGTPAGVLMKLIPDDFWDEMTYKFANPPQTKRIVRELQHLIVAPKITRASKVDVPADSDGRSRLAICLSLASIVSMIHKLDLVYGDISARNVLYRVRPVPSIFLVDCDAIRHRGAQAAVAQQNSPDWVPPENQIARDATQSKETDRYKLGLSILRTLVPGQPSNRDPRTARGGLDRSGMDLLRRTLSDHPADRPSAGEWVRHLRQRVGP